MRALLLTTNLDIPEAYLIKGLQESGINITLLISKGSPFREVLNGSNVKIIDWDFKSRLDFKSITYLRKLLIAEKFDVIHSFNARALTSALIASLGMKIPQVTYRGTTGHLSRLDPSSWLGYLNPKLSAIICVSDAVKRYLLKQGVAEKKLFRIYKGHNPAWYKSESDTDREKLGYSKDDFVVGCSANMRPVKGVDLLLEAFKELPEDLNIKLLLIGEVRDAKIEALLQHPKLQKSVKVLGFRKDAMHIISLCSAFCMPSRKREGLPKALIEAMIQGIAPIVTDVGGMPELVKNEEFGLIVPEENPKALAQAILKLYNDPSLKDKLGFQAKERIIQSFSISKTIEQTKQLYSHLTGQS